MEKQQALQIIQHVRQHSPKRNFPQTFDLLIRLKNLDVKKQDQKVDDFLTLPHARGKKLKICALVDTPLADKAKEAFDMVVLKSDFPKYKGNPKEIKKLAIACSFFVAQADLMGQIATVFGKFLGSRGLMPNPKAGCVVPVAVPSLVPLASKLQKTVRLQTKAEASIKAPVGLESMTDEEIADNVLAVYNAVLKAVPQAENNIHSTYLKLTMGPLVNFEHEKNITVEKARSG